MSHCLLKTTQLNSKLLALALAIAPVYAAVTDSKLQLADEITVSGLSSGAYMAVQFHVAFSTQVKGAALIAGGPLYCAQNSLATALTHCLGKENANPDLNSINTYVNELVQAQRLPDLAQLHDDKVWILHGHADTTVKPEVGKALVSQYQQWVKPANLKFVADKPFAHHFPTDNNTGTACDVSEPPFIASCNYDAAGELLQHLLGPIAPKVDSSTGNIRQLTQSQAGSLLAKTGFAYVPKRCEAGEPCRLHISFHGCKQHVAAVDDAYLTQTGLNEYADSNDLVILYPQAAASAFNPHGCWDWWGYTGDDYISKQAPQLQAVMLLVEQLMAKH
ncbi:PHB depolymerase family esterase [Arsukibacterium sp. UBA3155]|uniref:extracellular catalytic domain type 2 short-chain-length polyhydroxyalkanoate depolymerase n=1 Tax=Arsukibacterium sp. UBA3155 TaxID=1946058 RepID=UPI0025B881B4|nr:PHB depolymerase family esterase [Arsukibacterium sp. UBA3155]